MGNYRIEKTQPTVYLDKGGKPVRGFLVTVDFTDYDEVHELQVKALSPDVVAEAVETLLAERDALSELGV